MPDARPEPRIDRAELDRWMTAAAEGDRAAIAPLFQALWPLAVRYATRLVGDRHLAEDCAQDALAQLFAQIARYDPSRDALTWALTLTTWQCRSARRRRARRGDTPLRDDAVGGAVGGAVIDGAAAAEHRDLVRAALAAIDGLAAIDVETIAIAVSDTRPAGAAAATFRKRLERALTRLRTSWRSRHGTL